MLWGNLIVDSSLAILCASSSENRSFIFRNPSLNRIVISLWNVERLVVHDFHSSSHIRFCMARPGDKTICVENQNKLSGWPKWRPKCRSKWHLVQYMTLQPHHVCTLRDWSRAWPTLAWLAKLVGVSVSSSVRNTHFPHTLKPWNSRASVG